MKKVTISDHALVRYLERVGGFDTERLRRSISDRLQPSVDAGARGVVIDGYSLLIDYSDRGPVVITVLPVTRAPRNLMGGGFT